MNLDPSILKLKTPSQTLDGQNALKWCKNKIYVPWIQLYLICEGAIEKIPTLPPTLMPPIENVKIV